jgi:6-phosphogluconolactonase/glucosamine-6-phosphate isomerase/deaminase
MTAAQSMEMKTFESAESLAQNAAEWLCAVAESSEGDFGVCLSGGSTPRRLYQLLATPAIASRFPWTCAHTASLFPGHPVLKETRPWVAAVDSPKYGRRITLTSPALDSSRDVAFLATGRGKREIIARAQAGDVTIPAGRLRPVGRLHWFMDRAAASGRAN